MDLSVNETQLNDLWISLSLLWLKHCVIYIVLMNYFLLCFYVYLYVTIYHQICQLMDNIPWTQASDDYDINYNRMVKLWNSTRVCHQRYCMEVLTNIYLQYGKVGYLIMFSGHRSMVQKWNGQHLSCFYLQTNIDWSWK